MESFHLPSDNRDTLTQSTRISFATMLQTQNHPGILDTTKNSFSLPICIHQHGRIGGVAGDASGLIKRDHQIVEKGDIVTGVVDLTKGEISWEINGKKSTFY